MERNERLGIARKWKGRARKWKGREQSCFWQFRK